MTGLLPYGTALLLGSLHALEADHMAAVTAFAVRRPTPVAAARFGLRWALGHGTAVALAGLLLLSLGVFVPPAAASWLDRAVGVVLIGLGIWIAWYTQRLHAHHEHAATMVGLLHGAAGAAPVLALLQIAGFDSTLDGLGYLLVFATGTAAGMSLYALLVGCLMVRMARSAQQWTRWLGRLAGLGSIAIGLIWLLRS